MWSSLLSSLLLAQVFAADAQVLDANSSVLPELNESATSPLDQDQLNISAHHVSMDECGDIYHRDTARIICDHYINHGWFWGRAHNWFVQYENGHDMDVCCCSTEYQKSSRNPLPPSQWWYHEFSSNVHCWGNHDVSASEMENWYYHQPNCPSC